jgi:phospholipid N-methyltransferase
MARYFSSKFVNRIVLLRRGVNLTLLERDKDFVECLLRLYPNDTLLRSWRERLQHTLRTLHPQPPCGDDD